MRDRVAGKRLQPRAPSCHGRREGSTRGPTHTRVKTPKGQQEARGCGPTNDQPAQHADLRVKRNTTRKTMQGRRRVNTPAGSRARLAREKHHQLHPPSPAFRTTWPRRLLRRPICRNLAQWCCYWCWGWCCYSPGRCVPGTTASSPLRYLRGSVTTGGWTLHVSLFSTNWPSSLRLTRDQTKAGAARVSVFFSW